MISQLILNKELVKKKRQAPPTVDCWLVTRDESYSKFNALFQLLGQTRQPLPFFLPHDPLVKDAESKTTAYKKGEWVSYYQPFISVARRASVVPSLYPTPDSAGILNTKTYKHRAILCSVITPNVSLLSERQLRWLDLLKLKPVALDGDTSVVHLLKNEYSLLRRLKVFTSAHPAKLIAFPVESTPIYMAGLLEHYDKEFLLLPYFNIDESHAVASLYTSYIGPNGFNQNKVGTSDYQNLATNYVDMIRRYERCHQLTAIVSAISLSNTSFSEDISLINPFDIKFSYSSAIDLSEIDLKSEIPQSKQENSILIRRIKNILSGNTGFYKVFLPKPLEKPNNKSSQLKFFLAGLHSGMLPKCNNTQDGLIKALSCDSCNETNYLLDYNARNHLAFFNEVSRDDKLLPLYLRIMSNSSFFKDNPQLINSLFKSVQPLSVIGECSVNNNTEHPT